MLFTEDRFWNISTDAKLLYGILLDRMNLSAKNGWLDNKGRVYIIFTIEEIKDSLGCAEQKAIKLLNELEKKCGLIEKKRQGLGKPNLIYVKNFVSGSVESQFKTCENHNSGTMKTIVLLRKVFWKHSLRTSPCPWQRIIGQTTESPSSTSLPIASLRSMMNLTSRWLLRQRLPTA